MQSIDSSDKQHARRILRALYVEDDARDARLLTMQLERAGFEVHADRVATLDEFSEALRANRYDVILADHGLPNWSGTEALSVLREMRSDTPFIVVSGTMADEVAVECIKNGATDYVLKDRLARLAHAVGRALDESAAREERKAAERNRDLLAAIVESSDDAIVGVALEGRILSWNQGAASTFGYDAGEILGEPLARLFVTDSAGEMHNSLDNLRRGERIVRHEARGIKKDGSAVDISLVLSPMHDSGGNLVGASAVMRDISEYKRLRSELLFSQKMEAAGRLAAGVAHDFNNLLTVISGYSSMILRGLEVGHPITEQVLEIHKASERAASLTRQLLVFSRKQIHQPLLLDLNNIVRDMHRMLRRVIGEDIELVTVFDPGLGSVRADSGHMEQIIMNLAVNARDAMPNGGKLLVETANVDLEQELSDGRLNVPKGQYIVLSIVDTGIGMDAETMTHIFEPFFTTKGHKGTGLGLSTVYGIAQQSGGSIWVESKPGQGTTFRLYLPRAEGVPECAKSTVIAAPVRGSETVLIVEDEDAVRGLVCELLKQQGYTVFCAKTAAVALRMSEQAEQIDLMITDVVMPLVSGTELAAQMANLRPQMKVIYMSGYTDDAVIHSGVNSNELTFLAKPFLPATLLRKVRDVLDAD